MIFTDITAFFMQFSDATSSMKTGKQLLWSRGAAIERDYRLEVLMMQK